MTTLTALYGENSQKQREENRALMQQVQQQYVLLQQLLGVGAGSSGSGEDRSESSSSDTNIRAPKERWESNKFVGINAPYFHFLTKYPPITYCCVNTLS